MKLSEMNTVQLAKTLCAIAQPVERLGKSKKIIGALQSFADFRAGKGKGTLLEQVTALFAALTPALLDENNLPDTAAIVAAMTDKTVDEVLAQKGMQTILDIRGLLDKDFLDFFTQSVSVDQTA